MNIRNYVSSDHVMSVNEIATNQSQFIQLLTIEISDKDKEIEKLKNQLEAYENMRKEAIEYIHNKFDRFDCDGNIGISMQISYCEEDLLNILNKVEDINELKESDK